MENTKKTVYIVDNSEFKNTMIEFLTSKEDIQIVGSSESQTEAEKQIFELKPNIVVLDIVLKDNDGFVLMDNIRHKMDFSSRPKMLVISQLCHDGFIEKALKLGASYYLKKPVSLEVIYTRIQDIAKKNYDTETKPHSRSKANLIDEKISNIFLTVGIPAHIKGYSFLREAIKLAIDDPEIINSITKKLYPGIAEVFNTTASKVERAIRHAIEVAWNRGKIENINNIFGIKVYSSQEKPTNGEFIALVADKMLFEVGDAE